MITEDNQFVKVVLTAFIAKLRQNGDIKDEDWQFPVKTSKLAYQAYLFLKKNLQEGVLDVDTVYEMWVNSNRSVTAEDEEKEDEYEIPDETSK